MRRWSSAKAPRCTRPPTCSTQGVLSRQDETAHTTQTQSHSGHLAFQSPMRHPIDIDEPVALEGRRHVRICVTASAVPAQVYQDIGGALRHLHARGIAHLDVKPENIYRSPEGYKLGDFGSAARLPCPAGETIEEGDARYLAPELLQDDITQLDKADMWALGASLYEKHTGKPLPKSGTEYRRIRSGRGLPRAASRWSVTNPVRVADPFSRRGDAVAPSMRVSC